MKRIPLRQEKFIFLDKSGRRWFRTKAFFSIVSACLIVTSFVALMGLFDQPKDLLLKFAHENNFKAVQNVDDNTPGPILVNGQGTFVEITQDYANETYKINRFGPTDGKRVVLTFDDGPDPNYTPKILEILKQEQVQATFFLVGTQLLKYPDLAKQITDAGFEVGNHTFTHTNTDLYKDKNQTRIDFELNFTQSLIQEATGKKTTLFRNPYWGGENDISLNTLIFSTNALDKGYTISTPTQDSNDWQERDYKKIISKATTGVDGKKITSGTVVLLLHDAGGDRQNTILALPEIIKYYKQAGFEFTTTAMLSGQPAMSSTNFFEKIASYTLVNSYKFVKALPSQLSPIFLFGLVFTLTYSLFIIFLANIELFRSGRLKKRLQKKGFSKFISVLVPAYNEEKVLGKTLNSILASNYKNFEVIVIDDGSSDKTLEVAKKFQTDPRVKVFHKENGGKFSALNFGIEKITAAVYVALDADTQITPDALGNMARFFSQKNIAAVAGNVRVGNRRSLIGIMQSIEYTMNLNLERNGYSLINSVLVVPGALGAWRTRSVREVGGYSGNTLTEDAELTIRLLKKDYKVVYDKDSIAYTEAPKKTSQLANQRIRWTFGVLQTFFHHRDVMFRPKRGYLGMFVLPFTVFVQIPIMVLTPFMDLFAIYAFFFVSSELVIVYLVLYLATRLALGIVAYMLEGETPWPLFFLPVQRFWYQPILYFALYRAIFAIFKGRGLNWNKIARDGSVNLSKVISANT
jgi:peptidoglycan-N-acetylglucosamine deacetylase